MKWALILCGLVITWLLTACYFLVLAMLLHAWWTLVPTMGWHTSVLLGGLIVVAGFISKFLAAVYADVLKSVK